MGTTTPLYALLLAIPALFDFDLMWASFIINAVADCLAVCLILFIVQDRPVLQFISASLYLSHPGIIVWSANGMEMSLFVLLGLLTTYLFYSDRFGLAGIGAALLLICRIDGALLLGAIALASVLRRRNPFPVKYVAALIMFLLPWVFFSLVYFGTPIPQSAQAKLVAYSFIGIDRFNIWRIHVFDVLLVLPACIGGAYLVFNLRKGQASSQLWCLLALSFWFLIQGLFFTFLPTSVVIYGWYRVPQHMVFSLLAAMGLTYMLEKLYKYAPINPALTQRSAFPTRLVTLIVVFIAFVGFSIVKDGVVPAPSSTQMHLAVGQWLNLHAKPSDTVMAGNIGYIGYFSQCRVLDDVGLVSPQVLPIIVDHGGWGGSLVETFKPEYLALDKREVENIGEDFIESQGYLLVARYHYSGSRQSPYSVYERVDK